jgi:hypothetical protein
MTTKTETQIDTSTETEFDEVHVHCCLDPNILLCGFEGDGEFVSPSEPATCVVCADLDGTDFCPRGFDCYAECEKLLWRNYQSP